MIIIDDFNCPHHAWNCKYSNLNGESFFNFIMATNYMIHYPNIPTYFPNNNKTPSTLDLALIENFDHFSELVSVNELTSDHNPILTEIGKQICNNPAHNFYEFSNANWEGFRKYINNKLINNQKAITKEIIDSETSKLTNITKKAMEKFIPNRNVRNMGDRLIVPEEVKKMIRLRNKYRKIWQASKKHENKLIYSIMSKKIKTEIRIIKNTKWSNILNKTNNCSRNFWKLCSEIRNKKQNITVLKDKTGSKVYSDLDKAVT